MDGLESNPNRSFVYKKKETLPLHFLSIYLFKTLYKQTTLIALYILTKP